MNIIIILNSLPDCSMLPVFNVCTGRADGRVAAVAVEPQTLPWNEELDKDLDDNFFHQHHRRHYHNYPAEGPQKDWDEGSDEIIFCHHQASLRIKSVRPGHEPYFVDVYLWLNGMDPQVIIWPIGENIYSVWSDAWGKNISKESRCKWMGKPRIKAEIWSAKKNISVGDL